MVKDFMGTKTSAEKGYSVSALARMMGIDRRTLAARLEEATPLHSSAREKLYRLSDAMQGFIAQPLQGQEVAALAESKGRKLAAEAELLELRLGRERGELVPYAEVRDQLHRIFRDFHVRLAKRMPRELAQQLYRAESAAHVTDILQREMDRMFNEFRADHVVIPELQEGVGDEAE